MIIKSNPFGVKKVYQQKSSLSSLTWVWPPEGAVRHALFNTRACLKNNQATNLEAHHPDASRNNVESGIALKQRNKVFR